ncbi:MAG: hypothetical protein Q4E89_12535 [Eubacteriales bacterium]|nr:hypothetical protein [Eubacteriales bacterium]
MKEILVLAVLLALFLLFCCGATKLIKWLTAPSHIYRFRDGNIYISSKKLTKNELKKVHEKMKKRQANRK